MNLFAIAALAFFVSIVFSLLVAQLISVGASPVRDPRLHDELERYMSRDDRVTK